MTGPERRLSGVVWLKECESTNDEALARLSDPAVLGVGAETQTAGRGRRGRSWLSPAGGLYFSWIARPRFAQTRGGALPLLAGVGIAEACAALGVKVELKWPNDVLVAGEKLSGVLCEARARPDGGWAAVVGIGLNLRTPEGGWPAEIPATALDAHLGEVPTPGALSETLTERLQAWLERVEREGLAPVLHAWERSGPPRGAPLRRGETVGGFDGLAPDGGLRLVTETGVVVVHAGDVERVR